MRDVVMEVGDRPDEIEVTPEMIEAGERAFCSYGSRFEDVIDVVVRVYEAMERVRLSLGR
jgi:hypothetical protein